MASPAPLIRRILGNPKAEGAMKRQALTLARQNLQHADVVAALIESLPDVPDRETRDALLGLLGGLDTSRLDDLAPLHAALGRALKTERDREVRSWLFARLGEAIHQDGAVLAHFGEALADPALSDDELDSVLDPLGRLASIPPELAAAVLSRARRAREAAQDLGLRVAEGCTRWTEPVVQAVLPWLDVKIARELRLRILRRLAKDRAIPVEGFFAAIQRILRTDTDRDTREEALELFPLLKPWSAEAAAQLDWTIENDSDDRVRARARAIRDGVETGTGDGPRALSCPKCGGQLPERAAGRFRCAFCGATLELGPPA